MKQYFDYDNILEQRLTDDSGIVNDMLVLNNSANLNSITKGVQKQLVLNLENVFEHLDESQVFELNDMQKVVYNLREFYINSIYDELKNLGCESCWKDYQNFIMKNINMTIIKSATTIAEKCQATDYEKLKLFLNQNKSALEAFGCIGDAKQFALNVIEISRENEKMENFILSKE